MVGLDMIIVTPLDINNSALVDEVAGVLHHGFAGISDAWPDSATARAEVHAHSQAHHISLVAIAHHHVVGWIAANPQYHGNAWELHPLVVAPHARQQGIGRRLVTALCDELRLRGAQTLFVWCDDESHATTLSHATLYPNPVAHLATFHTRPPHAGGFYLKLGFALSGVLPNANGPGKPDILFVLPLTDA